MTTGNSQSAVANCTTWHTDHESPSIDPRATLAIAKFSCLIHDLIEGWKYVICKLNLRYLSRNRG